MGQTEKANRKMTDTTETTSDDPTNELSPEQKAWLQSINYTLDDSVLDCNPAEGTITVQKDGFVTVRQRCEVWTRVMGYHRPVSQYNKGKQQEHKDRLYFRECDYESPTVTEGEIPCPATPESPSLSLDPSTMKKANLEMSTPPSGAKVESAEY